MTANVRLVLLMVVMLAVIMGEIDGFELCNISEDGLKLCKPAVTKSKPVDPSPECCKALSGADFSCLCSYRNSSLLPVLGIDPDLAMALPSKCSNLNAPSKC